MRTFALTFNIIFLMLYLVGLAALIAEGDTEYYINALYLLLFITNIIYIRKSKEVK